MSDNSENLRRERVEKIFKRLEDTYPYAFALFTQISNNFSKIYSEVNPNSIFDKGETKYVTVGVGLDDQGKPRLAMGETATIFYTAMALTILEFMQRMILPDKKIGDLEKESAFENKACPNPECLELNKYTDENCFKCGTKLR